MVEAEHGWHRFTYHHMHTLMHTYMRTEANRHIGRDGSKEIHTSRTGQYQREERRILCYMFIHLSLFISILTLLPAYDTVSVVRFLFQQKVIILLLFHV